MSETTTNLLDLFCDTYGVPAEQKRHIESLMNMSYQEGKIAMRQEYIDKIGKEYGNTIRHNSGAAQN